MTSLVLGVDGGASKTLAVLAEPDGRAVGWGRSSNADIYQTPDAVRHVEAAIAAALASAGVGANAVQAAALSLVGADWPEDKAHWREALPALGLGHLPAGRALVANDALGALAAGAPEGPAVAVTCGTGGAVGARGANGATWHSSFWQRRQGGHEIGTRALDAVYEAELGIAPATALRAAALALYGVSTVEDLLHRETGRGEGGLDRAAFAPCVLDAAAHDPIARTPDPVARTPDPVARTPDPVARAIVEDHADALAAYGLAAARRVSISGDARLVLSGGVFRHPSRLMPDRVAATMAQALPGLVVAPHELEPVGGAVLLALAAGGHATGPAVRARLARSLPGAAFFHTAGAATAPFVTTTVRPAMHPV